MNNQGEHAEAVDRLIESLAPEDAEPNWGSMACAPLPRGGRSGNPAPESPAPQPMRQDAAYRNRLKKRRRKAELAKLSKKRNRR